ncbi:PLD nuclease N-terminal domain-containing protein [Propionibacterium australiense]|uniref:PLDc_N domain-containing protein n=1 Tax=Propionibacterium australiense TaxID=119981 RepID=A0A383S3V6_9ACTN|nr:PLD nuclease N-terminal domain-containing protein [Propionibacterium australiense]RLP11988.1 PLDc_N domain-containing protein [Propionibacterium australiense]RLP12625.1 PLDc_N domain-containing protein [Propionibacterium australiense]SYZ32543.1 Phospholipase_D-nuclease N-terminal [Propionibacterium australiense]VEH91706.1 Uncharacterised protein [Propionibacterium australiense]
MARLLPVLVLLALTIYAIVDLAQSHDENVPFMPKWLWLFVVIFIPAVGPVLWIVASYNARHAPPRSDIPPDDNEDWLRRH